MFQEKKYVKVDFNIEVSCIQGIKVFSLKALY